MLIGFFLDFVLENMMLPGKVENWVVITDFEKSGLGDLGMGAIKQVMSVLTDNYRCRLGVNYVVNPAKSVYYIWTCVKPFLDDVTIDKVKILNTPIPQQLFTHCNPYQIEEKYGGKSPNATKYWPPVMPEAPYNLNESPRHTKIVDIQIDLHEQSAESEMIEGEEYEDRGNRRSLSRDEKILESPREHFMRAEHSFEERKNERYGEELGFLEDGISDKEQEKNLDNAKNFGVHEKREIFDDEEEKSKRKAERKERRRLRRLEKELEKNLFGAEENELLNGSGNEDKFDDKADDDIPVKKRSVEYVLGEHDKIELAGCGLCNTLPSISFTSKKCEVF